MKKGEKGSMPTPLPDNFDEDNRDKVFKLAQYGCTLKEIASVIGCCEKTIQNHFPEEYNEGKNLMRSNVRKAQIELAVKERNPTMLIWLGKQYLDQKEPKQNMEVSGKFVVEKVMFGDDGKENKDT